MNLKQLSDALQLSQTTVSRALNGYPEVSEDTRIRVMEAARRYGYKPNPSARRLATGKSGAIGYVLPVGRNVELDPHFVEFLSGLGEFALTRNIDLVLSPALEDDEDRAYRRIASHNSVDVVYLSSMRNNDTRIPLLQSLNFPFIAHGRTLMEGVSYSYMDIDNEGAFYDAARLLLQLGHRRIALFNGDENYTFAVHRRRGFMRALESFGVDPSLCSFRSDPMNEENGYRRTFELFAGFPDDKRPTAVLSSSMFTTLGVMRALLRLSLSVPTDVSVICHDDVFPFLKPESFSVPLTTTRSSIRDAGSRVCELLAKLSTGDLAEPFMEVWPVDLIVRASTGPAPV